MEKNKRIEFIDVARGIAMFLVILGHTHTNYKVSRFCYLLNLPIFIIVSGYFFKKDESLKSLLKKSLKILIPTFIVLIITRILSTIIDGKHYNILLDVLFSLSKNYLFKNVDPIGILWFVPFLVALKITFFFMNKISRNNKIILGEMSILFTELGIYAAGRSWSLPWSFDLVLSSTILFYFGYMLKEFNVFEKHIEKKSIWAVCTIAFWAIFLLVEVKYWNFELATRKINPLGIVLSLLGCMMIFKASYLINKYCENFSSMLRWVGKNTYIIFLVHAVVSIYVVPNYWISVKFPIAFGSKLLSTTFFVAVTCFVKKQVSGALKKEKEKEKKEIKNERIS